MTAASASGATISPSAPERATIGRAGTSKRDERRRNRHRDPDQRSPRREKSRTLPVREPLAAGFIERGRAARRHHRQIEPGQPRAREPPVERDDWRKRDTRGSERSHQVEPANPPVEREQLQQHTSEGAGYDRGADRDPTPTVLVDHAVPTHRASNCSGESIGRHNREHTREDLGDGAHFDQRRCQLGLPSSASRPSVAVSRCA